MCQFEVNCITIKGVRVPPWKKPNWPIWRNTHECLHIFSKCCTLDFFSEYSQPILILVIGKKCVKDLAQKSCFIGCFRYFNSQLRNGQTNYGDIRHRRLQMYKNWRFVFECAHFFRLIKIACLQFYTKYWVED